MYNKKSTSSCFKKDLLLKNYSLPIELINRPEVLLPYKSYAKKQSKQRNLKDLKIKVGERYKFNDNKLWTELKKLNDPLKDNIATIIEYDEEYFKIINGRPLFHCIPLYKSIADILNRRLRTEHQIGYKKDINLNIDINIRLEREIYDVTLKRFYQQAKAFDKFIMEDYIKSMKILDDEEKLNFKLDAKIAELQRLAEESFAIMSRLLGLDYKYGLQQKYGRFLYYLSPPVWRSCNREFARSIEIEAKGFDYGNSHGDDTFNTLFEKMRKECCTSRIKPVLYFTHAQDLVDVFNGIEKQLLYHFSRETQLVPHMKSMNDLLRLLKQKIDHDSAIVRASIKGFKNLLLLCEERSNQLKDQFFKILHGFFYESVGTMDVLKLNFHLEFCYSKIFHEKPTNLDMFTIAKAIENMYMDYSKRLDAIHSGSVRRAMSRCIDLNNQKLDKAITAAKELRLFIRLEQELLRSHNLPPQKDHLINQLVNTDYKYSIKDKIKRNVSTSLKNKKSYQNLTGAEVEYLTLFTDWTKNEDPALYLKSFSFDKDKDNKDD